MASNSNRYEQEEVDYHNSLPKGTKAASDPHQEEREEMEHYYANHPGKPSTYDKIVMAGKKVAGYGVKAARTAYDVGDTTNKVIAKQGQTEGIRQINSQSGFHKYTGQAAPRSPTSRAAYAGAPVDGTSTMHPGNHLYVIQGTMVSSKNIGPKEPRQPRSKPWQRGGLGGNDPGF